MSRRKATDQAAREERLSKIRQCPSCDPCGWKLGPDRTPIEPAVRCSHDARPLAPIRDFNELIHRQELDL